jgi:hypothetical protein
MGNFNLQKTSPALYLFHQKEYIKLRKTSTDVKDIVLPMLYDQKRVKRKAEPTLYSIILSEL